MLGYWGSARVDADVDRNNSIDHPIFRADGQIVHLQHSEEAGRMPDRPAMDSLRPEGRATFLMLPLDSARYASVI
ncbi:MULTISPECIES: hypothetical protein [Sphingomonas]|nr:MULTISPECIES: hypothetical protein [Sphingomonas]AGH48394.1 hypothetical protein G432_03335 [Sphingomonas sp. MM-1]MDX3883426.1 hypothetical protein [Sphingomonas sp.]